MVATIYQIAKKKKGKKSLNNSPSMQDHQNAHHAHSNQQAWNFQEKTGISAFLVNIYAFSQFSGCFGPF